MVVVNDDLISENVLLGKDDENTCLIIDNRRGTLVHCTVLPRPSERHRTRNDFSTLQKDVVVSANVIRHNVQVKPIPFDPIHLDHKGPFIRSKQEKSYILAISDAFSKFVIVKANQLPAAIHGDIFDDHSTLPSEG
ncbi:unnamed protein product [Ceratitis capitata]|uniref:(Mediterranean fruit fly) hypothetical protein n=1 Tax=Ceratitis capitata TaxID=7213 RepID=A0A811UC66_CERCA|nr:unnamed protein product [Ceratitis capitata]